MGVCGLILIFEEWNWEYERFKKFNKGHTECCISPFDHLTSGHVSLIISWKDKFVFFKCKETSPGVTIAKQKWIFEQFVQRGGAPGID